MSTEYSTLPHQINTIDLKQLNDYIVSNVDPRTNTITIYNFFIGSKTEKQSLDISDIYGKRNHECPKFIENMLFNPELQLSPELINSFSSHKEITIRQVVFLIDPSYIHSPEPFGLLSIISHLPSDLTIRHIIKHNASQTTIIISKIEPVIIPNDITELHLLKLFKTIKHLRKFYPMIVNVMDCTSVVATKIFTDNIDSLDGKESWLYITKPECLIIDTKKKYIPMLAFSNCTCEPVVSDDGSGDVSGGSRGPDLFITNKLNIRWVNFKDDEKYIDDLQIVSDVCTYSKNLYEYIISCYKEYTLDYSLFSIYKLWTYTTYTMDYKFNKDKFTIFGKVSNEPSITVNLSTLNFEDFSNYWHHKEFKELPPFNYEYDTMIINKFINYFINKYKYHTRVSFLGLNPSIVDFIKLEAFEILSNLGTYFPNDLEYLPIIAEDLDRKTIKTYLANNGITF